MQNLAEPWNWAQAWFQWFEEYTLHVFSGLLICKVKPKEYTCTCNIRKQDHSTHYSNTQPGCSTMSMNPYMPIGKLCVHVDDHLRNSMNVVNWSMTFVIPYDGSAPYSQRPELLLVGPKLVWYATSCSVIKLLVEPFCEQSTKWVSNNLIVPSFRFMTAFMWKRVNSSFLYWWTKLELAVRQLYEPKCNYD